MLARIAAILALSLAGAATAQDRSDPLNPTDRRRPAPPNGSRRARQCACSAIAILWALAASAWR